MGVLTLLERLLPAVWPLLVNGLLLLAVPDLMRPGLFFGRTVAADFRDSPAARTIRRHYSSALGTVTLIALGLAVLMGLAATGTLAAPAVLAKLAANRALGALPTLFQIALGLCAFIEANRATRAHAVRRASVVTIELPARPDPPSSIALAILALPIVSLAVLAAWTALHWHFGRPERWVAKTPAHVATLFLITLLPCALPAAVAWGVLYGSRRVASTGEAATRERRFRGRFVALMVIGECLLAFPAWAGVLALPAQAMTLWQLASPAAILILAASLLLMGQGGSRGLGRSAAAPLGDRTDDGHWLWGLLYFNRADPAFLVEKRFGIGYSFNLAHPLAWALGAVVLAIPLLGRLL